MRNVGHYKSMALSINKSHNSIDIFKKISYNYYMKSLKKGESQ